MSKKFLSMLLAVDLSSSVLYFVAGFVGQFVAPTAVGNTQSAANTSREYGFIGSTGAKILVRSSPSQADGFYFKSEAQRLYIKIGGIEYQILNLQLSSDGKNFQFKEVLGIKSPIYSSDTKGTPPSLIVRETGSTTELGYFRKYLLYVNLKGDYDFNGKYKIEAPYELESRDQLTLRSVSESTAYFTIGTLGSPFLKYQVYRGGMPFSYLLVTPCK